MEHLTNGLPEQAPAPLQCSLAVHSLSSSPGVPGAQNSQYQAGWSTGSQVAYKHGPQLGRVPLHTAQAGLGQVRRTVSAATRTAAGTPIVLRDARICTYHPKGFALQRVPARWPMTGVQQDVRRTTLCGGTPERTEESADPGPGAQQERATSSRHRRIRARRVVAMPRRGPPDTAAYLTATRRSIGRRFERPARTIRIDSAVLSRRSRTRLPMSEDSATTKSSSIAPAAS